ncbi:MAG TPA: amidohydrolase family protein [Vicinamibacteria bacterium]|nr:amidohydrolase family protein [Vicinamibacteria bacterium]
MIGRSVLCLALAAPAGAEEAALVLKGGRVVTVSGAVIESGSVVVAAGRIVAVGADVAAPPGAQVLDVAGKWIYPGLVNGLTSLGLTEITSVAGSMDTTEVGEINPNAKAWVALNPHSAHIAVARAGGLTAALSAPEGGLVSGQSAVIRLAGSTPEAMTVRPGAALHVVFPSGRPPAGGPPSAEEREKKTFREQQKERGENQRRQLDRLRTLLEDAKAHDAALRAAAEGRAERPKPDAVLEALAPAARGEMPVLLRADAEEEIRAAVEFAAARGLKLVVAGGLEAWRCADLLKEKEVAVLLKVLRLPRRRSDPYDAPFANAALLHRAGVPFAIVTDDESFARNLPYEAAMARAFGLPAEAALRAITLSPAEILGVSARLGSIEAGKDADLVVATGDIMDARTRVEAVYIQGAPQPLDTRHTQLYQQFRERP